MGFRLALCGKVADKNKMNSCYGLSDARINEKEIKWNFEHWFDYLEGIHTMQYGSNRIENGYFFAITRTWKKLDGTITVRNTICWGWEVFIKQRLPINTTKCTQEPWSPCTTREWLQIGPLYTYVTDCKAYKDITKLLNGVSRSYFKINKVQLLGNELCYSSREQWH